MGVSAALIGPAISAGSALYGLSQGAPASNVQMPNYQSMQLPGVQQAASNFTSGTGQLQNTFNPLYGNLATQAGGTLQNVYNDPNAASYQAAAYPASLLGQNAALGMYGLGGNLNMGGTAALNMGLDPQQALYNRTLQQLQDQVRVANSAAGVASSPYGAGLENQALSNFNIDWQNQQLQRALQGLSGAGTAYGQGTQLQTAAPGQFLQSAGLPYATSQGIGGQQFSNLGQYGGLLGTAQQGQELPLQNYANYVQMGNAANANANQAAYNQLAQAQAGFNQNLQLGGMLGASLGGLGRGWQMAGLPSMWGSSGGGGTGWGGYSSPTPYGFGPQSWSGWGVR